MLNVEGGSKNETLLECVQTSYFQYRLLYTSDVIYEPYGTHPLKTFKRYIGSKDKVKHNTLKSHQSQENRAREKRQELQKQAENNEQNGNEYIPINKLL